MTDLEKCLEREKRAYNASRKRLEVARQHQHSGKEQTELNKIEEHKKQIKIIKEQIQNT